MLRTGTTPTTPATYTVAPTFATYEEAEVHVDEDHYVEWQFTAYAVLPYLSGYDARRAAETETDDGSYYRYDGWH